MDISIERAIANYFTNWLSAYPYVAWLIAHPLPGLGLLLLTIFALSGLLKAISRGFEQVWLLLLQTPFKLIQPVVKLIGRLIFQVFGRNSSNGSPLTATALQTGHSEQIDQILSRLQALQQEQQDLVDELATLVGTTSARASLDHKLNPQSKQLYAKLIK